MHIKKNTMAKVVNQNDLIQIIKESTDFISNLTNIINNTVNIVDKIRSNAKGYLEILQIVYGTGKGDGLLEVILNADAMLRSKAGKMNFPFTRRILNGIFREVRFIIRKLTTMSWLAWFNLESGMNQIFQMFNSLGVIGDAINKLSFSPFTEIKLEYAGHILENLYDILSDIVSESWWVTLASRKGFDKAEYAVNMICNVISKLSDLDWFMMLEAKSRLKDIESIFKTMLSLGRKGLLLIFVKPGLTAIFNSILSVVKLVESISTAKIGIFTGIKFSIIEKVISDLNENAFTLIKLGLKGLLLIPLMPGMIALYTVMSLIISIINKVSQIKMLFIKKKFKIIYSCISLIRAILGRLKYIGKVKVKYIIKLILINMIFSQLKSTFINASLAGLAAVIFALTSPALILGIMALLLIVKIIAKLTSMVGLKTIYGMGILIVITTLLLGVATSLLLLGLISFGVMKNIVYIIGFLILLIPVIGAIILVGLAVSLLSFVAIPAVVGVAAMAIMVVAILFIAGMLRMLEYVKLDHDKIHTNLDQILGLSKYIMTRLFDEDDTDAMQEGVDDSRGFIGMFKAVFGGSPLLIQALASSLFLVSTVISVLAVLFIVAMFKLIEDVKLNKGKILNNIGMVTSISKTLIDILFGGYHTENSEGKTKVKEDSDRKGWIGRFFGGIGLLVNTICSSAFLLSTFISVSLLMIIAGEFKLIEKLELDKDKILGNIGTITDLSKNIIDLLFGGYHTKTEGDKTVIEEDSDKKNWISTMFEGIGGVISTICSSAFLLSTFISVGLLFLVAKTLNSIQNLTINSDVIRLKIQDIMTTCREVMNIITSPVEGGEESKNGFWSKILGSVKSVINVADAVGSMGYMAMSIACIGLVKLLANNLVSIGEIVIPDGINEKVSKIFMTADSIVSTINNPKKNSASRNESQIKNAIKTVSGVFKLLETINDADFKNSIVETRLNLLDRLKRSINEWVGENADPAKTHRVEKFIDKNIQFLNKINNIKFRNLKTAAKMFEQMAEFSESINGNFEGLAEALNEKIAPLLEELNKGMEGVGKKVEKTGADMSASISANSSNTNMSPATMSEQVRRENPNLSQSDVQKLVDQRMGEQSRQQSEGLEAKLEELLELFRTGQARVVLR